jgi:hypothetical protein
MEVDMKPMVAFAGLGLAACTAQPPSPPPAMAQGGAQVSCIDLKQVVARHVLPPASVLVEMSGGITYRTDLVGGCPSAARADANSIVQTESQGTQLCQNDHIRIYDPVEAKATGSGAFPQCRVGPFTAVPNP